MKRVCRLLIGSVLFVSPSFAQQEERDVTLTPKPTPKDTFRTKVQAANDQAAQAEYQRAAADMAMTKLAFAQKTEKASYIGVATSPMPAVLREQLKLDKGVGLVVDRVEPQSPAEAAGLKAYDVIQKLDDQVLINPHQFGVLVRTLKAEQEVKLSIIREAKPLTIAVKPIEKELAVLDETAGYGPVSPWRDAIAKWGGGTGRVTVNTPAGTPYAPDFTFDKAEMMTVTNDNMIVTTTVGPKGDHRLNAIDKATGKILFDGPIDTDEQKKDLPKEVADQIANLDGFTRPVRVVRAGGGKNFAGNAINLIRAGNNLPKPKAVSGSDDDYTWEFTTKMDEKGKAELDLLLLDKNGKKLFDGPFSRTRDMQTLPAPVAERLGSYPWDGMIEDLKSGGGGAGGGAFMLKMTPPAATPQK